jgi:exosortase
MTASDVASTPKALSRRTISWSAVGIIALVWLELISRLRFEWSINPQYGYGWTVPFLTAFVFARRWERAPPPAQPKSKLIPSIAIIAGAFLLIPVRLIQEANPDWRLMSWSMTLAVVSITGGTLYFAGGKPWLRHFAFPILFFLVAVPWPTQLEQFVIQGLMRVDTAINVELLNTINVPAVQMGNVIEIGNGFVGIDEACTGVRSLQATLMVSLFLGELYDFSTGRRFLLVVVGAIVAFICNLTRTFLLVLVGAQHGSDTINKWHDPAGLSILFICLLILWGLSIFLRKKPPISAAVSSPAAAPCRISRGLLGWVIMATLIAEAGTHIWYRLHESPASRMPAWAVEWPSHARDFKSIPVAQQAQELLRYNEGGGGAWRSNDGHQFGMYFFRWLPGRTAALFIKNHRPDICLPASGMKQIGNEERKLITVKGVPLPIRSYVFDNHGIPLHVYYCYWNGTVPHVATINDENWTASGRLRAVRDGKREVGAQMLEIVAWGYDQAQLAEEAIRNQLENIIRPG